MHNLTNKTMDELKIVPFTMIHSCCLQYSLQKFALYNADRVNFKSRNYHVVAYNISILAEGLHFSALVFFCSSQKTCLLPKKLDFSSYNLVVIKRG